MIRETEQLITRAIHRTVNLIPLLQTVVYYVASAAHCDSYLFLGYPTCSLAQKLIRTFTLPDEQIRTLFSLTWVKRKFNQR